MKVKSKDWRPQLNQYQSAFRALAGLRAAAIAEWSDKWNENRWRQEILKAVKEARIYDECLNGTDVVYIEGDAADAETVTGLLADGAIIMSGEPFEYKIDLCNKVLVFGTGVPVRLAYARSIGREVIGSNDS